MKCINCDGEGTITIIRCINYSNECCGSCYKEIECNDCQGTGTIYSEKNDDEDYSFDINLDI